MTKITYKEKLSRQFRNYALRLLAIVCSFVVLLFMVYALGLNAYRNNKNSRQLLYIVEKGYDQYAEFLEKEANGVFLKRLQNEISDGYTDYYCNSFDLSADFSSNWILTDADGNIIYSNTHDKGISTYMEFYIRLTQRNAEENRMYYSVYAFNGSSYYVMTLPVFDQGGERLGTVSCYIDGSAIENFMHQNQFDGIVIGSMGRTIAASNWNMLDQQLHFQPQSRHSYTYQGKRYDLKMGYSEKYELSVVTLLQFADNVLPYNLIVSMLVVMVLLSLLLAGLIFASRVAELNSKSLEILHSEINAVQCGNGKERIHLSTGDEFEDIANHINQMLDRLQELGDRNMELGRLNNQMERLRLEAQFDPHFLYNTLESIRYGIRLGDSNIDGIILKLTSLLRYSIGENTDTVTLDEDLRHLQDYLDIICYRFESRFQYEIDILQACRRYSCPRLCLQPIVENSIKYSLSRRKQLKVSIAGWEEDGFLCLQVSDDGVGMRPELVREMEELLSAPADVRTTHYGLRNIDRRLKLQFSQGSGISLTSQEGIGTTVRLRIGHREDTI